MGGSPEPSDAAQQVGIAAGVVVVAALALFLVAALFVSNLYQWWVISEQRQRIQQLEQGPSAGEWRTYKWYLDEMRAAHGLQSDSVAREPDHDHGDNDDPGTESID